MKIKLKYGKNGLDLSLPKSWQVDVFGTKPMKPLDNPADSVAASLAKPIGSESLPKLAKGCETACILICDVTRPVPNGLVLGPMIKALSRGGIDPKNITIIIATGLHRPNHGDELERIVGDQWVLDNVAVKNHYARKDADHINLGRTKRGTPVHVDRRFHSADLRLVVGLVEPHFMAGYSGGRKLIVPGVAHERTITSFHTAQILADSNTANCVMDCNPFHQEMMQAIEFLEPVYAVNVVLDHERNPCLINFGDVRKAHKKAVEYVRHYVEVPAKRLYKTVITSGGGHPLDATYYQTVKGMIAAAGILEEGGSIFIASECSQGLGSDDYRQAQAQLVEFGPDRFLEMICGKDRADVDQWQTQMQVKAQKCGRVNLHSKGLSKKEKALTGVKNVDSLEKAVKKWVNKVGENHMAVIPEGPYVVPRFDQSQ